MRARCKSPAAARPCIAGAAQAFHRLSDIGPESYRVRKGKPESSESHLIRVDFIVASRPLLSYPLQGGCRGVMYFPLCSKPRKEHLGPRKEHLAGSVRNVRRGLESILWIPARVCTRVLPRYTCSKGAGVTGVRSLFLSHHRVQWRTSAVGRKSFPGCSRRRPTAKVLCVILCNQGAISAAKH